MFRDAGDYSSYVDTPMLGYNGVDSIYTETGLSPGKKYRFIVRAKNSVGFSVYSYQTIIVAASLPNAPTLITKNSLKSNKTSITV